MIKGCKGGMLGGWGRGRGRGGKERREAEGSLVSLYFIVIPGFRLTRKESRGVIVGLGQLGISVPSSKDSITQ